MGDLHSKLRPSISAKYVHGQGLKAADFPVGAKYELILNPTQALLSFERTDELGQLYHDVSIMTRDGKFNLEVSMRSKCGMAAPVAKKYKLYRLN